MKALKLLTLCFLILIYNLTISSSAGLYDRGRGLIYDDVLNITWLQDAGLGGAKNWDNALKWVNNFVFAGYDDWRLPHADPSCEGYNCTGSELGYLYYIELGNSAGGPLTNTGPFINLRDVYYWSGSGNGYPTNPDTVWDFNFSNGYQDNMNCYIIHVWAVRSGDSPLVQKP